MQAQTGPGRPDALASMGNIKLVTAMGPGNTMHVVGVQGTAESGAVGEPNAANLHDTAAASSAVPAAGTAQRPAPPAVQIPVHQLQHAAQGHAGESFAAGKATLLVGWMGFKRP